MLFQPFWWWKADTRGAEVISAVLAWMWGLILLHPYETFRYLPNYRLMSEIAPEWVWGAGYLLVGALQSMAMCGNVHYFRYPAAVLSMLMWLAACYFFAMTQPVSHAPFIYGVLAFSQFWVILRGPQ
jgi:hypothetical protein